MSDVVKSALEWIGQHDFEPVRAIPLVAAMGFCEEAPKRARAALEAYEAAKQAQPAEVIGAHCECGRTMTIAGDIVAEQPVDIKFGATLLPDAPGPGVYLRGCDEQPVDKAGVIQHMRDSLILGNPEREKFFSMGYKAGAADTKRESINQRLLTALKELIVWSNYRLHAPIAGGRADELRNAEALVSEIEGGES